MRKSAQPTTRPRPLEGSRATLYFGNTMVTTEMKEQIQYASQAPRMQAYICERLEWTDTQYMAVNWPVLGRTKKRLLLHESIRITKMLYENLNVGKQKRMMGKDATCPCCGIEMEDQIHLYQCQNEEMTKAFNDAVQALKSKLVKDGIPSDVYNAYIDLICKAARRDHPDKSYKGPASNEAHNIMELQDKLGSISILRGFLHREWTYLLQRKKLLRVKTQQKSTTREKDAIEQTVSLVKGSWDIFEAVWKARNGILHGGENEIDERANSQMLERLLEYRSERFSMLRICDHFIIDVPVGEVIKWSRDRRKAKLATLDKLHRLFVMENEREARGLRAITDYFQPITKETEGDGD
jgi:hypothetical protein